MPADDQVNVEVLTQTKKSIANLVKLGVSIFAAKKAFDLISKSVKAATEAYGKQELAIVGMESALRATGEYTPQVSATLQQLSADLQDVTTYGDEVTMSAIATLQSLAGLNEEGLVETIPLIQDFAAGFKNMGMTMETAASLFGKTLGSTTNALTRYGIVIDMSGTKAERLAEIQTQINEKFGGRAADMADTYAGKIESLGNVYGDLQESIGGLMAQHIEPMLPVITDLVGRIGDWAQKKLELKEAYEKLEGPMSVVNDYTKLELLQAEQLVAQNELRVIGIRNMIQVADGMGGTYEELSAKGKELVAQKEDEIRVRHETIGWLEKEIEVKQKLVDVTEEEGDAVADAAAVAESNLKILAEAYAGTAEGIAEANEESLKFFEDWLASTEEAKAAGQSYSEEHIGQLQAIIAMLEERLEAEEEVTEAINRQTLSVLAWKDAEDARIMGLMETHEVERTFHEEMMEWISEEEIAWAQAAVAKLETSMMAFDAIKGASDAFFDSQLQGIDNLIAKEEERHEGLQETYNADMEALKAKLDSGLIDQEAFDASVEALDKGLTAAKGTNLETYDKKRKAILTQQAKADKAASIIAAVVNVLVGVTKAISQGGIFGLILGAIVLAAGMVTVGMIAAKPIPTFAEGGIVTEPTVALIGEKGPEAIVPLTSAGGMGMGAGRGEQQVPLYATFNIDGRTFGKWLTMASRNKQFLTYAGSVVK